MTTIAEPPRISHPALFSSTAAVKAFANGTGDPYLDLPTPDGPPVPLHDLHPPFPISALSLLERSPPHPSVDAPAVYMASDDTGDPLQKDMAGKTPPSTLSDSAKHTGASRQRPPSQPGPSPQPRRQPPMRPPFHNPPSSSSTSRENASNSPGPPGPPPTYPAPSPYPPSSFGQHRNSFVGPQYAMSTHQPSMSAMHSSTQYVYSHHPGMHDPSIAHMAYSSPSHMPMIHAPMFPSYTPPDQGLNMQHPFSTAPPPQHSLYAQPPVDPSPPPISPPQGSGGSHSGPHVSTSFGSSQNAYGGYSAPHQYAFRAPHSYAPTPTMYSPTYPSPFPQSYGASNERESQQGTWWYLPPSHSSASSPYDNNRPSFQPSYSMGYSPSVARRDGGYAQGQPISPTAPSPASPRRQPVQTSWVGESQTSMREDPLSPAPAVIASPKRPKLSRAVSSLSEPERVSGRQSYHPNPPAQRSEWVMWAGNVPSDATHDELWRFFNQPLLPSPSPSEPDVSSSAQTGNAAGAHGGVSSIFLISRSNCAFVNFETEKHLQTATARFNGQPIRPNDPRCPRLVCRVRRRTDDLKAGVGGQRGLGMHTKWVKEQKTRMSAARTRGGTGSPASPDTSSPEDELAGRYSGLSMSDDEGGRRRKVGSHTDSSGSFASTNSSFLAKHFPQRYFILKSLTQHDLDLSVQRGVWATQRHNEGILDQAFRTSQDVYLIFGVNKSGEFYGYARMTGGISQSQDRIPWESTSSSQGSSQRKAEGGFILSPREHRFADSSPQPVSAPEDDISFPPSAPSSGALLSIPPHKTGSSRPHYPSGQAATAPAEMGDPHLPLSHRTPIPGFSLNVAPVVAVPAAHHTFELDTMAPYKAIRHPDEGTSEPIPPADVRKEQLLPVQEELAASNPVTPAAADADAEPEEVWGQPFRIEWIKTDRLPFYRTRHLRNPWNHGREVKVSRDGTELEPTLGKELLEEWDRPAVSPPTSPAPAQRPLSQRRARPLSAAAPASTTRTS